MLVYLCKRISCWLQRYLVSAFLHKFHMHVFSCISNTRICMCIDTFSYALSLSSLLRWRRLLKQGHIMLKSAVSSHQTKKRLFSLINATKLHPLSKQIHLIWLSETARAQGCSFLLALCFFLNVRSGIICEIIIIILL